MVIQRRHALSVGGAAIAFTCAFGAAAPAQKAPLAWATATPTVDCETRAQLVPDRNPTPLRGRGYIAAGPVTFTAWFRDEPRRLLEPERGRTKLIKAPIFVDAGGPVRIELARRSARRAKLDVERDQGRGARAPSVRLVPCPPDAMVAGRRVGRKTPFVGGYRIKGPMCMRIKVIQDGAAAPLRKRMPFGRGSCRRHS